MLQRDIVERGTARCKALPSCPPLKATAATTPTPTGTLPASAPHPTQNLGIHRAPDSKGLTEKEREVSELLNNVLSPKNIRFLASRTSEGALREQDSSSSSSSKPMPTASNHPSSSSSVKSSEQQRFYLEGQLLINVGLAKSPFLQCLLRDLPKTLISKKNDDLLNDYASKWIDGLASMNFILFAEDFAAEADETQLGYSFDKLCEVMPLLYTVYILYCVLYILCIIITNISVINHPN